MARLRDVMEAVAWSRKVAQQYGEGFNEIQARCSLIDPVLYSLGWDVADPEIIRVAVAVDFKIGKFKFADYAFFDGKRKSGVVEAKSYKGLEKFGCNLRRPLKGPCLEHFEEGQRHQMYSLTKSGFKILKGRAVLTDGIMWEIYDPRFWKPGQIWSKKLRDRSMLASVCLVRDQGAVSKTLYRYLRRGSF